MVVDDAELSSSSKHRPSRSRSISPSAFPQPTLTRLPSTSDLSVRSSDDLWAPGAAVALAGIHSPEVRMDSGHRRRRSSLINPLNGSAKGKARRSSPTKRRDSLHEDPRLERASDESTSEDMELDQLSDDGLQDDEETGLTGKDKDKRKRRRRQNTLMDHRVAADIKITEEEKKEADKSVVKNLLLNGMLIGLWYIFSLSISIYNKWMFDPEHLNFHFPLFTTCFHMLVQFSLSSLVLLIFPQLRPRYDSLTNPHNTHVADADQLQHMEESKKPLMTKTFYFTRIGPCGMATGLDIGLGNMSLKFITLTFYTMCKSSSLAFVLLFAFVFQLESPSWRLVGIIATMTAGVIMMVAGEVAFSALGFILVISAAFFSGFRWALTQILLLRNPATANPFSSIFYLAPIMFFSLFLIAIPVEGFPALFEGIHILVEQKGPFLGPALLLFPGSIAFCMTASEFALLKRTSVVTLSIAGIFKEVVTISAAGIVFGDNLTPINISGLFVTIGAIAAYNYIKITKMRAEAQKEAHQHHLIAQREEDEDGDDEESELDVDWNTVEGTYVTMDGDILPNPDAFKIKNQKKKGESSNAEMNALGRTSVEPSKADIATLAASKKELSD
ncbi:TPT-domain-containing protein [Acephala macrosclerotiorum]|nr:TPT-domain-containing protein [Acephala macrosclerotiorum]